MIIVLSLVVIVIVTVLIYIIKTSCVKSVIVSMSTIPERLESDTISKTLDSIMKQTYPVKRIHVNIPYTSLKGKKYPEDIIEKLKRKYPNVFFDRIDTDYGPITKLLPTIKYLKNNEWIVLVDDDVIYDKNMIKPLIDSGYNAVGYACRQGEELKYITSENIKKDKPCDILETYAGVLYKGDIFNDFEKYHKKYHGNKNTTCLLQDDLQIAHYLKEKNIKRMIIKGKHPVIEHNPHGTPSLGSYNTLEDGGNRKCYDKIFKRPDSQPF